MDDQVPVAQWPMLHLRMPQELYERLRADAFENRTNMTAIACDVLAKHYKIEYEPSGRRSTPVGGGRRKP